MTMTVGGIEVARENGEKRQVTVVLSRLAFEGLTSGVDVPVAAAMAGALRCYLGERGSQRPAWPYPDFLRGSETEKDASVELELDTELWREFEGEAERQGVSVEQLAEHAAFYFAAELDAGRVTQRILDELESGEGGTRD
ncbi:MAG TPA: hypothetical protein VNC16_10330 [Solirubrobacterales bacterium]|nr:hypothetical protein [Solirubrobacterales bacterium]